MKVIKACIPRILFMVIGLQCAFSEVRMSGSMEFSCGFGRELHVHLTSPSNESFIFRFFQVPDNSDVGIPITADALRCSSTNQCQRGVATVVFKALRTEREGSGVFTIEFPNGPSEKGKFKVLKKKQGTPFICD